MAKTVHSQFPISGSHGPVTFYIRNGKNFHRERSSLTKEKWLTKPKMKMCRWAAWNFGGAAKAAMAVWKGIAPVKHLAAPNGHSQLTKRMVDYLHHHERPDWLNPEITLGHVVRAFGASPRGSGPTSVPLCHLAAPNNHSHHLAASLQNGAATVSGLDRMAAAIAQAAPARTRWMFRLHVVHVPFVTLRLDHDKKKYHTAPPTPGARPVGERNFCATEWLPAEGLDGNLDLPLPFASAADGSACEGLFFLAVEWRAYTGRRYRNCPELATLALAGFNAHAPETTAQPAKKRRHRPSSRAARGTSQRRNQTAHPHREPRPAIRAQRHADRILRAKQSVKEGIAQLWKIPQPAG